MSLTSQIGRLAALTLFALSPVAVSAHEYRAGDLEIQHPWTRATPGGAQVAGGYMIIVNRGKTADTLTGGSFDAAATFEMHEMTSQDGVMTMRPTGPLTIPPGGTLKLDPSGKHIMFTGLKHGLKTGEMVSGTLVFEHAGTVPVSFKVEAIGAKQPAGATGHHDQTMPGMNMD